jgi:hypothetical protein
LQVFSNQWLAHAIYLKTSNTPLDLYNTNKLIYTLSMHENRTGIFGQHDPGLNPLTENEFGMKVYIMTISSSEYNKEYNTRKPGMIASSSQASAQVPR